MSQAAKDIELLAREIAHIVARMSQACVGIASALSKPLPQDSARITSYSHEITSLVRTFSAMLPRLDVTMARLSAENAALATTNGSRPPPLPPEWYALRTRADRLRTQMNLWHEVQALVSDQIPLKSRPLYVAAPDEASSLATQTEISDALFAALHKMLNPLEQDDRAEKHGCFPDITLPNSKFLAHAHAAYRLFLARRSADPARFLDVGCGSGMKVISAAEFFGQCDGLEFDPGYVSVAKRIIELMRKEECHVFEGDALRFEDYHSYDVIYLYRPLRDPELMQELEARIVGQARPGTIIIAPYGGFSLRCKTLGCAHVAGQIYLSDTSQEEAEALTHAAEHMGVSVTRRKTALPTIWEPVLAASHANGYGTVREAPYPV